MERYFSMFLFIDIRTEGCCSSLPQRRTASQNLMHTFSRKSTLSHAQPTHTTVHKDRGPAVLQSCRTQHPDSTTPRLSMRYHATTLAQKHKLTTAINSAWKHNVQICETSLDEKNMCRALQKQSYPESLALLESLTGRSVQLRPPRAWRPSRFRFPTRGTLLLFLLHSLSNLLQIFICSSFCSQLKGFSGTRFSSARKTFEKKKRKHAKAWHCHQNVLMEIMWSG